MRAMPNTAACGARLATLECGALGFCQAIWGMLAKTHVPLIKGLAALVLKKNKKNKKF